MTPKETHQPEHSLELEHEVHAMDLNGKTCMVTGATAGIGKATALSLAQRGATVALVSRNRPRGERVRAEIARKSNNDDVELFVADLASQRQVRGLADSYAAAHDQLDVLINNAGLFLAKRALTEDGIEVTFAVNHLAPYLLTHLLLPLLQSGAPARIVNVTSDAHQRGSLDFGDLHSENGYNWIDAYAQSKLANVLFTYELARRLDRSGVTANCMHPGVVATRIWNRNKTPFHYFLRLFTVFYMRPSWSAKAVVRLASSPDLDGVTGKYFDKMREARSSRASYDEDTAKKLWDVSAELTGIQW